MAERTNAMPQFALLKQFRVIPQQKEMFAAIADLKFEPGQEVLLETAPNPAPDPRGGAGEVKLRQAASDFLEIEADLPAPAILLITDSYTPGWKARALPGSSQSEYSLLPADYCLRAVPLGAGHHELRVEYTSTAFRVGTWVSLFFVIGYAVAVGSHFKTARRNRTLAALKKRSDPI